MSYCELGNPARLIRNLDTDSGGFAKSVEDFVNKTESYKTGAYVTAYRFRELIDGAPLYDSAIINGLFLELDSVGHGGITNEVRLDCLKLFSWAEANNIELVVNFSGRSGFHVWMPFKPIELRYPSDTLREAIKYIRNESGADSIDLCARNGASQMRRIINSRNDKSGLYAIPITKLDLLVLTVDAILEKAKAPQFPKLMNDKYLTFPYYLSKNLALTSMLKNIDDEVPEEASTVERVGIVGRAVRPCIQKMLDAKLHSYIESNVIAFELIACGFDNNYIMNYFNMYQETPITIKMLDNTRKKGIRPYSCKKLRELELCDGRECKKYWWGILNDINKSSALQEEAI